MTTRRQFLSLAAASAAITTSAVPAAFPVTEVAAAEPESTRAPIRFALNTATIRGQDLSITDQIDIASKAGYDGIEPWIRDLEKYVAAGGSLPDLRKRIEDAGLTVPSGIGFAHWIVEDQAARAAALEVARRDMELLKAIGGTHIAAPPIGAHQKDAASPPLAVIGDRFRALLQVGDETGVVPQLELWGFSPTISKLAELVYVATATEHPSACVLPDFYHIYKGGNDFAALGMIEASRMHCFHINDYPDMPCETIGDKDRVFPGDGVCPLVPTIKLLVRNGFMGTFSLELFNPEYWKRDALDVAKEGLEKSRNVVAQATSG
ncbi:sugar phosphate isomerase/epimerase family protein [Novipirellula artificiosorum]|uniref:Inosose isomerase n=1 Tax=Novipirellula artificiosorum TaxID=2528016 RepID=A0A5C6DDJ7_9BACT|nr:sugar phosphate isomerase/epimerase family protein [Novipirellula artificiosorum]TWU33771.1 Inosose isomerase [Novipirellula artificiosorum]